MSKFPSRSLTPTDVRNFNSTRIYPAASRDRHTGYVTLRFEIPGHPGWNGVAEFDDTGSEVEMVSYRVMRQDHPDAKLRTGGVEPAGTLTRTVMEAVLLSEVYDIALPLLAFSTPKRLRDPRKAVAQTPDFYATWAAHYVRTLANPKTRRSPRKALAEKFPPYSPEQIRDIIHACRVKGYLTPAKKGSPGGELTDEARRVLEGEGGRA